MPFLTFDYGRRHIGVAVAEPRSRTASALRTVSARGGRPHWAALDVLVAEWQPEGFVVGLPLNMDGTESEMSAEVRRFATALAERYGRPIQFADERLSTFEAVGRDAPPGGPRRGDVHAAAAKVIAETWLAEPEA